MKAITAACGAALSAPHASFHRHHPITSVPALITRFSRRGDLDTSPDGRATPAMADMADIVVGGEKDPREET